MFATSISPKIQALIGQGIKALLSFKPAFDPPTGAELTAAQFHRVFQHRRHQPGKGVRPAGQGERGSAGFSPRPM